MADFSHSKEPFYFKPIIPGTGDGEKITFMSTITSFNPSFSGDWESSKDMGRADNKYLYSSISREVGVSFMLVAVGGESTTTFNKELLNSLIRLTYPTYQNGDGYNGIYTRMVIGNLFNEIGILTSVDPTPGDDTAYIDGLPVVWNVDISFTTLGETKPKFSSAKGPLTGGYQTYHGVY